MALVDQIQRQPHLGMRVVGFLDDDRQVRGRTLAGVKVIGGSSDLRHHSVIHRVQTILIPTPAVPAPVVRDLVSACDEAKLRVQIVPGLGDLLTGTMTVRPGDVEIQDLLARDSVPAGRRVDRPAHPRPSGPGHGCGG